MRICVEGYEPIVVPPELAVTETGAFDGHTPYVAKLVTRLKKRGYRERTLPSKLVCLEAIKARMYALGGYKSFAEPLAGVGLSARIFRCKGLIHLNDLDEGCQRILALNFPTEPTGQDALKMKMPKVDVTFLDFNDFTMKRYLNGTYKAVVDRAMESSKKFVVINDCSIFYFRYGANSYETYTKLLGEPIVDTEAYFVVLRRFFRKNYPDWWLVEADYFRDTSFLLFSRNKENLVVRYVKDPKPIVSVQP